MITSAPSWLAPIVVAPFIGSFLGVLAMRVPAGRPVFWARSACDRCGRALSFFDLVPVASWLFSRGRCRHCGGGVTSLYTLIELGAAAVAIWAATAVSGWILWASCVLGWGLVALAVIDVRDGILPDLLTLPMLLAGLGVAYAADAPSLPAHIYGVVAGFAGFGAIRWLYRYLRGREGLGLGDVKLLAAAGAWVAWQGLPSVVLIAAIIGLGSVLLGRSPSRPISLQQRLAFGPGLCLGIWLVWLYGPLR